MATCPQRYFAGIHDYFIFAEGGRNGQIEFVLLIKNLIGASGLEKRGSTVAVRQELDGFPLAADIDDLRIEIAFALNEYLNLSPSLYSLFGDQIFTVRGRATEGKEIFCVLSATAETGAALMPAEGFLTIEPPSPSIYSTSAFTQIW